MELSTAFSLSLLSVYLSVADATREIKGEYTRGGCEVQGLYPHDAWSFNMYDTTRRYSLGEEWNDRCSNCSCTTVGAVCETPSCHHSYDFSQEEWCLQWSEDGCCCERMGCTVDGQQYSLGESFPYDPTSNSCLSCLCHIGWTREQCLMQKCNAVEWICENRTAVYQSGSCCPVYVCPRGVFCDTIPDPFPDTARHELLDWYGGRVEPIPQGMTQHFHVDTWSTYVCSCPRGGTATCEMKTFGRR